MKRHRGVVGAATSVGLFAFVLGALGSWIPSLWYDEVATVYSSRRSISDLIDFLRTTDAVHGSYYVGIHLWGSVFGFSEFSVRLPSALAIGIAASGVVVLGSRLSRPSVGVWSGLVFALLPRVTWASVEARSYALTAAAAVWLTVLLVVALSSRSRLWWLAYALLLAISIVLFVYLATIVVVHLAMMLMVRSFRSNALPWGLAVVAAIVLSGPFLRVVLRQSGQVSWIPPLDSNFARIVFEYQWFLGAPLFGVVFGVVLVAALILWWRDRARVQPRGIVPLVLVWIIVPMAAMAAYSLVKSPIYLDRYLTFTTPAVALLGGAAIGRLETVRALPYIALAALALALVPGYVTQRSEWAKPLPMDFSDVNDYARAHIAPGDCVLFGRAAWNPSSQRLIEDVDPSAFANGKDIGLATDATESDQLWDVEKPVVDVVPELRTCDVLWYFTDRERDEVENLRLTSNDRWSLQPYHFEQSEEYVLIRAVGFRIEGRTTFDGTQVVRLVR